MRTLLIFLFFVSLHVAQASENISINIHSLSLEADYKFEDTTLMIIDKKQYPPGSTLKTYEDVSKEIFLEFYGCANYEFNANLCRLVAKSDIYALATKNYITDELYPNSGAATINFKLNNNEKIILLVKEKTYFGFRSKILGETAKLNFENRGQIERMTFIDNGTLNLELVKK